MRARRRGWAVWAAGVLALSLLGTVGAAVWKAGRLAPLLPKLASNDYLSKKLHLPVWVPLAQVSPLARAAIVTSEDDGFYANRGFELGSIWDAFKADLLSLSFKRGASTITQQVIKNTFLDRRKTLGRKVEELVLAWKAERILSKDRILEVYLNTAQWGRELYGIEGAARRYFGVGARDLTLEQGVYLAALLPNPLRYGRSDPEGKLPARDKRVMDSILERMLAADKITADQFKAAQGAPLTFLAAPTPGL